MTGVAASEVEITLHGLAHGGEAVGRLPDGKACFVPYGIPGERVRVRVTTERKRWARAELVAVIDASPDRIEPPCPYFGQGACGGCTLQHIAPDRQAALRRQVLVDQLERIGKVADPPVTEVVRAGDLGYRHQARFGVRRDGVLGFRRAGSHNLIPIDRCLLLDDATQALRERAGDAWAGAEEVAVRSAATGTTALVVHPGPGGLPPLPPGDDPVGVAGTGGVAALRGEPVLTHVVCGLEFRVSARSFFQANHRGAAALLRLVRTAAAAGPGDHVLDLYAGVGLFARGLAAAGAGVTAVESDRAACADARHNLAAVADRTEVVHGDVTQVVRGFVADGLAPDVVVLDPPRDGAGVDLARLVAALGAATVVYVACDPAALARDTRVLLDASYRLTQVVPVDQFAQTAHIEAVATFRLP